MGKNFDQDVFHAGEMIEKLGSLLLHTLNSTIYSSLYFTRKSLTLTQSQITWALKERWQSRLLNQSRELMEQRNMPFQSNTLLLTPQSKAGWGKVEHRTKSEDDDKQISEQIIFLRLLWLRHCSQKCKNVWNNLTFKSKYLSHLQYFFCVLVYVVAAFNF